ncbi:hypothetical protein [Limnoraphis robusta]|uniref:Uncharacterized protein n=1 Tax=Limnoraphis robusta CS-951 TaxID=1637645 RepID=A0A0F5YGS5_9CYAN|nr:hypothetical protein [Limnoraphis robusta]KKD38089.1 hypothetical protein WN50_10730 [Limnoraphis robusta CS-951]
MGSTLRYWCWVRLDGGGKRQVEEISSAKAFFQQQFPEWIDKQDVPDAAIQRKLVGFIGSDSQLQAQLCLRCFISHQIDQTCLELARRFGEKGGFNQIDLLPFVLDDVKLLQRFHLQLNTQYESLADKILQTFNPEKGQLSTWTARLVRSHGELQKFLEECGIYLESDWSLLNNYYPQQLERLLTEFYNYNSTPAQKAREILDSYQTVYLSDRLQQNRSRSRSRCQPPTPEQLNRIIADLEEKGITGFTSDDLLEELESLAELIRRSRHPQKEEIQDNIPLSTNDETEREMEECLQRYRQLLITQLDPAIVQVLQERLSYFKKRKPPKDKTFIQGLQLYCQGQSMSEIARKIGLKRQDNVTRLLQLKTLREDIQQRLLSTLKDQVIQLARYYNNLVKLERLEQALAAEIDRMMEEAQRDTMTPNCSRDSLFFRRLCRHLEF